MNRATTPSRSDLANRATAALSAASAAAARSLDAHAAEYELSDARLEVLAVLCDQEQCCLHELGDELGVTRPNITKLVDGLEACGLVERIPHPHDGRMVRAVLTERGAAVARDAIPGRRKRLAECWSALSDEELDTLASLLERLTPDSEQ